MYTTVLNVRGESALHAAVAKCRSSASAPGVLSYSGDVEPAGVAVLIQPMVDAAAAGVAFTADPVSGDRDVVVIDAVRGLGDQLVSGAVTPERWEVRTRAGRRTPDADRVIDAGTADEIAGLARRIADVQGGPQDVEWALTADGELVVLQARPITSLADEGIPVPIEVPEGRWIREASHAPLSGVPVAVLTLAAEAWQAAGMSPEALTIADTPAAMGPAAPYPAAMADRIRGSVESDPTLLRAAADRLLELGFAYEAAVACAISLNWMRRSLARSRTVCASSNGSGHSLRSTAPAGCCVGMVSECPAPPGSVGRGRSARGKKRWRGWPRPGCPIRRSRRSST